MKIIPRAFQKTWCHDLDSRWNCLRLLWSRFCPSSLFFWLFLRLRCQVMDPCFVHGYKSTQKNRLYGCKTSPNTWLKHPYDTVFIPLWSNAAPILRTAFSCPNFHSICDVQQFLKCLLYLIARALLVNGHPIPFCGFSLPFLSWSPHLVEHIDVRLGSSYDLG